MKVRVDRSHFVDLGATAVTHETAEPMNFAKVLVGRKKGWGLMLRRISALAGAAAVAGAALVGLSAGTAGADPTCPDVHWIGAAGSGERTGADLTTYNGMGRVVNESLHDLSSQLQTRRPHDDR